MTTTRSDVYGQVTIHGERAYKGWTLRRMSGSQSGYRTPWVVVIDPDGKATMTASTYPEACKMVDVARSATPADQHQVEAIARLAAELGL